MHLLTYDTLDSTNEQARRLVECNTIRMPFAVLANAQSAGRGTRGRCWHSPSGAGLYLSVVTNGVKAVRSADWYTTATGVACAEFLREQFKLDVRIRGINDLMVDNCKLGGILTEAIFSGSAFKALIIGVGINIYAVPIELQGAEYQPISLEQALRRSDLPTIHRLATLLAERIRLQSERLDDMERIQSKWRRLGAAGEALTLLRDS